MMATIALNIWGLTNSFLHLFLRANANSTAIRPAALSWSKDRRSIFGPSDLSLARTSTEVLSLERSSTDRSFQSGTEKSGLSVPTQPSGSPVSKKSFYSPFRNTLSSTRGLAPLRITNPDVVVNEPTPTRTRTPIYSPFPRVFSQQSLPPPIPAFPLPDGTHSSPTPPADAESLTIPYDDLTVPSRSTRIRSSVASSATVQIGLRISNAIAIGLGNIHGPSPIPAPLRVPGAQKMLPPTPTGEKDGLPRLPDVVVTTESGPTEGEPRASRQNGTWI
ncbi:MAG: hypothetical protein M1839_008145 [Geoglossum umbratile]|nr:MAG: hypothetical protein M1839_008145 [Geoglossum umbratile]